MTIAKPIISIVLLFAYICCFGAFSFGVILPDDTKIYYDGWLI